MPRLAIDYGSASTRAVLGWPDGQWTPLAGDGGAELSSAVHVDDQAQVLVGAAAWRQAPVRPDGFLLAPARAGTGQVTIPAGDGEAGDAQLEVAELVAATLRTVAGEAAKVAGGQVEDVRLVVPAGWGPRRRTWLRQAAHRAGLGQPRLAEAPVAAATRLTAGAPLPEQALLLIVDVGAGCEATVLRHGPGGFEVLSTLADPAAGGDQIDTQLTRALTGVDLEQVPAGQRWPLLSNVRAAKQALSEQVTVTMPMPPPAPPMIVHTELVRQATEPVLERAGAIAAETVGNADLTVDQLHAVYAIGGTCAMPGAAELIGRKLGRQPEIPAQPGTVAVLGAADTAPATAGASASAATGSGSRTPPLRRLAGLALPGLASLLLYGHFVATASFHNGTPDAPRPFYYVLATWGELALAALFALITCLAGASLFAPLLRPPPRAPLTESGSGEGQIAAGIGLAAAAGAAVAALYGVTAAVYFAQPIPTGLRWALLPILPTAACAAALAALARRRPTPPQGWDGFLAFPAGSVVAATVGAVAVAVWWQGPIPAWLSGWAGTVGRVGGVLIGVAAACALVRHPLGRLVLGLLLGFVALLLAGSGLDILAVLYALAASAWWGYRTWLLTRTVSGSDRPRHATT